MHSQLLNQALIKSPLNILVSLLFLLTVFFSPRCSIFLWYFFFQFSKVVDFKVSLKALVLNMLLQLNVHSRDDDFFVLIGFDHTPVFCFTWVFSVLLIVEIRRSVLMIGFFRVWERVAWSFELLLSKFSIFLNGTRRLGSMIGLLFYSRLLLF